MLSKTNKKKKNQTLVNLDEIIKKELINLFMKEEKL